MAALSLSIDAYRPLNRWDHDSIRPGPVGSVGDVHLTPRFKQSAPDLPMRFDPVFAFQNEVALGSNVTDGQHRNYDSGGGPARTRDTNWGNKKFKTRHGWIMQDLRAPDTLHEPETGELPHYDWNNRIATAYNARRTGNQFLPLPHGYGPGPGDVPRGGQVPRIVATEAREEEADLTNRFRDDIATGDRGVISRVARYDPPQHRFK